MNAPILLVVATLTLYATATGLIWRERARQRAATGSWWVLLIGVLAVIGHGAMTALSLGADGGLNLDLLRVLVLLLFVATLFVMVASFFAPVSNLLLFAFPGSALVVALYGLGSPPQTTHVSLSAPLIGHILFAIVAYGILLMATGQSLLLAFQERRLKARNNSGLLQVLPPLETMERLLFAMLWLGIVVLTFAIATGFGYLDNMFGQRVVHHTILACLSWLVYALLLAGRHLFGWRGTTAVRFTLVAFVLLVLAYLGSKFVIEILLSGSSQ
ncbi:MAG: inner membrane protein YpjD [Pseudomonadales bacterium]